MLEGLRDAKNPFQFCFEIVKIVYAISFFSLAMFVSWSVPLLPHALIGFANLCIATVFSNLFWNLVIQDIFILPANMPLPGSLTPEQSFLFGCVLVYILKTRFIRLPELNRKAFHLN